MDDTKMIIGSSFDLHNESGGQRKGSVLYGDKPLQQMSEQEKKQQRKAKKSRKKAKRSKRKAKELEKNLNP